MRKEGGNGNKELILRRDIEECGPGKVCASCSGQKGPEFPQGIPDEGRISPPCPLRRTWVIEWERDWSVTLLGRILEFWGCLGGGRR